jgi:hypothetical protein
MIENCWNLLCADILKIINVKFGRIPSIYNRQSKIYNGMLGCDIQFFEYGINNAHNPISLVLGCICDADASDPIFGAHQEFEGKVVCFQIYGKVKGLAIGMLMLDFSQHLRC